MKFCIKSESGGRMRIHAVQKRMTYEQADILEYTLQKFGGVASVKVYDRTCDAVIYYTCSRNRMIEFLRGFSYAGVDVPLCKKIAAYCTIKSILYNIIIT